MNDTPFTTIGDEPVEARIVAWVLGEASAFEAAELERLCDERPELMIFKRRMLALHGLLAEAEKPKTDESWKLPPEKRRAIEDIFGEEKRSSDPVIEKRVRHSARRALLAIAACLVITLIVAGLFASGSASIQKARKMAGSRQAEKIMPAGSADEMAILSSDLTRKRIEGTPKPMNVPNLESPVSGPVASSSWQLKKSNETDERLGEVAELSSLSSSKPATPPVPSTAPPVRRLLAEGASSNLSLPEPSDSFGKMNGASNFRQSEAENPVGGELAQRQPRPRVAAPAQPAETAMKRDSGVDPFAAADDDATASRLPARKALEKSGSGALSMPSGRAEAIPSEQPLAMGDRSGDGAIQPGNIDAILNESGRLAGEKASEKQELAEHADMPVLGDRFSSDEKSDLDAQSSLAGNDELSGANTYTGGTTVTGGTLGLGRASGYGGGGAPASPSASVAEANLAWEGATAPNAEAKENDARGGFDGIVEYGRAIAASGAVSGPSDVSTSQHPTESEPAKPLNLTSANSYFEKSKSTELGEVVAGVKYKLQTGNENESLFRGADLAMDGATLPNETAALAKEIRDQEDKVEERRKVLGTIVRNKGIIYKGGELSKDEAREEAIKRGLDAQDYVDAKSEYETDAGLLERMKLKLADGLDADSLAKAVRDQEDKVEERRKVLATIVRNKGIYKGQDSFYRQSEVDEDQGARNALQTYHEIEQEKLQFESQISSLLKYDGDELMLYAGGLNLPDNAVRALYPQYQEAKRQLDAEKIKGLGESHPSVQAKADQVQTLKRQIDESVVTLRATLQAQHDLAAKRLKSVEAMKDQTREEAIKRGLDAQDYVDAKKEFEKDQELLQQMRLKLMVASKNKPEPPKPDLTKLMEEIPAVEEPYSTFSLNISDASFQVAQAALAKGERPDPAGIKVEQFYNAVDYGDPAPGAGEPVSCAIEQAAHPVIPGRNLVRIALKTAAAGRSASQPLRLTLLVDQSGSMVREDRRTAMNKALAGLSELLTGNDLVTVIGFSRTPRLLADGITGDKAGKLADLINIEASEGGTNLEEAIKLGEKMADRRKLAGAQNRIVLFTDGAANLGNADPELLAEKVKQLRQKGIAFDIAGIAAEDLNDELLGELARNGNGRYYIVGKGGDDNFAKQLAGAFRPAAENVKVQVRFNPERVGRYKLIGFEKDRLKTEDFRNDKVDAAELAAEEAGVAIYQVEPLPEGHGELGEVSVRFRDTARNEMVERSWTISHDSGAPAIDRATPSMQLATLAMFAGEKLKGGPLAEAIDFNQLTAPAANVKQLYGNTGRVGEMLRMVDALK